MEGVDWEFGFGHVESVNHFIEEAKLAGGYTSLWFKEEVWLEINIW